MYEVLNSANANTPALLFINGLASHPVSKLEIHIPLYKIQVTFKEFRPSKQCLQVLNLYLILLLLESCTSESGAPKNFLYQHNSAIV